ncbi:MAG: hypothetical protein HFH67_08710 [Lachnospiraceae bacterium]|nr:hypothetical protein [Lachnospiraceae bacterium]
MEDIQETEIKTVISLLENISKKLDSISEYAEFKKQEELFKREFSKCYPRGQLLMDEEEGYENRISISKEIKSDLTISW